MEWCIKKVNRLGSSAFSPDGAVDVKYSSSANLDIFELDCVSDAELILSGTVPSSERFNRLSWGKDTANSYEYSIGFLAGGLVDWQYWPLES